MPKTGRLLQANTPSGSKTDRLLQSNTPSVPQTGRLLQSNTPSALKTGRLLQSNTPSRSKRRPVFHCSGLRGEKGGLFFIVPGCAVKKAACFSQFLGAR